MSRFLEAFSDYIKKNGINIYRIAEVYGDGKTETVELKSCNPCQNSYSVSKFFTLTAVGLLCDDGSLDTDEKITDILAAYCPKNTADGWYNVTVDMVIRHHCGLPSGYLDIDCDDSTQYGKDYLSYILSTPIGDTSKYVYTDAAYYILSRIVAQRAGKPMTEFLWERLFGKLGFREVAWSCCPMNHAIGATGLYIRTEDMVKLGALYLNKGIYKGERVLSEKWIAAVLERGYLQRYTDGGYGHGGMRGQMLMVIPDNRRAVAWHGFHNEGTVVKEWLSEYLAKENIGLDGTADV